MTFQHDFARSQIAFEKLSSKIDGSLPNIPLRHILNTWISNFQDSQYDMVRLELVLYGVSNDSDEQINSKM
jgi:alanine racemase